MLTPTQHQQLSPIVQDFILTHLKDRFKQYVSHSFLHAHIMYELGRPSFPGSSKTYGDRILERSNGDAYAAVLHIFEVLLEHRCGAGCNGNNLSQDFDFFVKQQLQQRNI